MRFIPPFLALLSYVSMSPAVNAQHQHDRVTEQQLGTVHFPISCDPRVQKQFERGVALLHSFAFDTAETAFRQAAQDDPHCAMAHWGIATTFSRWAGPDEKQRKRGWDEIKIAKSLHPATARERDYIAAEAAVYAHPEKKDDKRSDRYLKAMEKLYRRYPEDHEAAAFYALALEESDSDDNPTHARRKQAAPILEKLFVIEPQHPGVAHYLIHTYDVPEMAELGLPAARRYAQIAPAAPHALHMPSHIFARLGMWQEDIDSNLASIAASRNAATTRMGDEGHQYHAMEFLMYAYLQSCREEQALKLVDEVKALPKMKSMYGIDADPQVFAEVSYPASYLLELHDWAKASDLPLTPGTELGDDSITYLARAIGEAQTGHADRARQEVSKIESLHKQVLEKKLPWADWVDHQREEAEAWADYADGKNEEAIRLMRKRADAQVSGVFAAQGDLPAREMLADMLLGMKRPEEALREYNAQLKINPKRFDSLYGAGQAAELMKQPEKAADYYRPLAAGCANQSSTRPELAHAREFISTVAQK